MKNYAAWPPAGWPRLAIVISFYHCPRRRTEPALRIRIHIVPIEVQLGIVRIEVRVRDIAIGKEARPGIVVILASRNMAHHTCLSSITTREVLIRDSAYVSFHW